MGESGIWLRLGLVYYHTALSPLPELVEWLLRLN